MGSTKTTARTSMAAEAMKICDRCGETITGEVCHLYYGAPNGQPREHAVMDTVCMSMETERAFRLEVEESTPATPKRQSAEARRNAATQQAWQSLRYEGDVRGSNGQQEYWTCASASQPGERYTITHDCVSGYTHCTCPAGIHSKDCKHQAAARRYISERAANMAKQAAMQARMVAEARQRDTAPLRRPAFSFMR